MASKRRRSTSQHRPSRLRLVKRVHEVTHQDFVGSSPQSCAVRVCQIKSHHQRFKQPLHAHVHAHTHTLVPAGFLCAYSQVISCTVRFFSRLVACCRCLPRLSHRQTNPLSVKSPPPPPPPCQVNQSRTIRIRPTATQRTRAPAVRLPTSLRPHPTLPLTSRILRRLNRTQNSNRTVKRLTMPPPKEGSPPPLPPVPPNSPVLK